MEQKDRWGTDLKTRQPSRIKTKIVGSSLHVGLFYLHMQDARVYSSSLFFLMSLMEKQLMRRI